MLNVVLEEDSKQMEEVVVTGYQTVNRRIWSVPIRQ